MSIAQSKYILLIERNSEMNKRDFPGIENVAGLIFSLESLMKLNALFLI